MARTRARSRRTWSDTSCNERFDLTKKWNVIARWSLIAVANVLYFSTVPSTVLSVSLALSRSVLLFSPSVLLVSLVLAVVWRTCLFLLRSFVSVYGVRHRVAAEAGWAALCCCCVCVVCVWLC